MAVLGSRKKQEETTENTVEQQEKKTKKKKTKTKKGKESYTEIPAIIGYGSDYHIYHMTKKDRVAAFLIGGCLTAVVCQIFFGMPIVSLIVFFIGGIYAGPIYQERKLEKRKNALLLQFKDLLESLTASYSAGKNTLDAFSDAAEDMSHIYGKDTDIVREVELIIGGMRNNINVEELLLNFADRSGLEDVQSFADVFRVALRQGANIKDIIFSTRDIIGDKIEMEMDIRTMMAGNKNQLNIMMVMPLIIVVSLNGIGSGTSANSPLNIIIKLFALGIFWLAYKMGKKVTKIEF